MYGMVWCGVTQVCADNDIDKTINQYVKLWHSVGPGQSVMLSAKPIDSDIQHRVRVLVPHGGKIRRARGR